jgi:hypothetical protein
MSPELTKARAEHKTLMATCFMAAAKIESVYPELEHVGQLYADSAIESGKRMGMTIKEIYAMRGDLRGRLKQ